MSAYTNFTDGAGKFSLSPACPGPECGLKVEYVTALNGPAIYGYEESTLYGLPDPAHPGAYNYQGTAVFHVTKSPCGTGTFTEIVTNGTAYFLGIDPDTQTVPARNDWTIVSGSGTGQLDGIEGTGTDTADLEDFTVDELADPNGGSRGVHDGTLTCRLR